MAKMHLFTNQTPVILDANGIDNSPGVTLGTWMYSDHDGLAHGVRFYLGNRNYDGTQVTGGIYESDTQALIRQSSYTIAPSDAIGFITIPFAKPVRIRRNRAFIAAVYFPCDTSPDGKAHYVATSNFFMTAGLDTPPLHAYRHDASNLRFNGLFHYGDSSLQYPSQGFNGGSYFIDIDFEYAALYPVYDSAVQKWVTHPAKRRVNGQWIY